MVNTSHAWALYWIWLMNIFATHAIDQQNGNRISCISSDTFSFVIFWRNTRVKACNKTPTYGNGTRTCHYSDVIMGAMASQITSLSVVYSTVYSGGDQRKHQSSSSLAFVRGTHRWPVDSPHKWPVTRKMFPFDDVIMGCETHTAIDININDNFKI